MKIDVMTKDKNKKTVVPALRFPEFRDAEGWEEKTLNKILNYERPDNYIVSNTNYSQQGTPVLTANKSFILGYTEEEYGICIDLPVVIFDDFTVDKKYVDFPFKVKSSAIKILRPKDDDNLRFTFEVMNLITFEAKEHKRYYISSYQTQKVFMPKSAEQTKIAKCLASLDDLINAVSDKIGALKEYKKGLMQQLFPVKEKNTPLLRFPEFQNAGEWEESTLGDICDMQAGKFVSASEICDVKKDTMYPCYGGNGLRGYTHSFTHFGIYPLIGRQGAQCGNITYAEGKFHATEHAVVVTLKKDIDIRWLYYQLIKLDLNQYATGQAQPGLSVDVIKKVTIRIPKNKNEQQLIACGLFSVDELITTEIAKLDQLKAHKKGLMQQLFPKL